MPRSSRAIRGEHRGGFVPTSLSGMVLWLDAGQITGATDNASLTTWQDRSGGGRDAVQGGAVALKPIFHSTGALLTSTGKPVVTFDGANTWMGFTGLVSAQPYTILFVVKDRSTGNARAVLDRGAGATNSITYQDTDRKWDQYDGTFLSSGILTVNTAFTLVTAVHNGASSFIRVNGTAGPTGAVGAGALDNGYLIGEAAGGNDFWLGEMAEIHIYNRVLTGGEITQDEGYLKTKQGTP